MLACLTKHPLVDGAGSSALGLVLQDAVYGFLRAAATREEIENGRMKISSDGLLPCLFSGLSHITPSMHLWC
jgi:hypothetical protein